MGKQLSKKKKSNKVYCKEHVHIIAMGNEIMIKDNQGKTLFNTEQILSLDNLNQDNDDFAYLKEVFYNNCNELEKEEDLRKQAEMWKSSNRPHLQKSNTLKLEYEGKALESQISDMPLQQDDTGMYQNTKTHGIYGKRDRTYAFI